MKILIVDDLVGNRMMLSTILAPLGHYDVATDGVEALEWVEAALTEGKPYDLIMLDIMMPNMDGQTALQAIRAREQEYHSKEAVIIMVSADTSPDAVTQAFFKGYCTDYLAKPITRQMVLDKLKEYGLIAEA
ncbi:MAG: response regulator [Magnetococcus sp. DMHC-8]